MIVDPKSAVVVGAAIEFMARNGMLSQFKFSMQGKDKENTYFWGVMTESTSTIREERVLFQPVEDANTKDEWTEFTTIALRTLIGRKMTSDEYAQATPIYVLKMETQDRIGPTEVTVRIRRVAGHRGNRGAPGTGFGHRHRRRTAGRAGRKRVLQLADAGRRKLLPGHRRLGQHRNRPVRTRRTSKSSFAPRKNALFAERKCDKTVLLVLSAASPAREPVRPQEKA